MLDGVVAGAQGKLNKRRRNIILQAFDVLDKDKSGQVTIEDVASVYDTSKHPEVMEGAKTPEEVLRQFMAQWDTVEKDGVITRVRANGGGCTQCAAPDSWALCRKSSWSTTRTYLHPLTRTITLS